MIDTSETTHARHERTLLIVDDTPENITLLHGILREEYRIKVATDGSRALRIAREEPKPDMILLDIMMPGMDGFSVCQSLKKDTRTKDIPVIFVSAKDSPTDRERGKSLGAAEFIGKPVSAYDVKHKVARHLPMDDGARHRQRPTASGESGVTA